AIVRHDPWGAVAKAGTQRAVRPRRLLIGFILQIIRQYNRGYRASRQCDARRTIDQMAHLRGRRRLCYISAGHILEHRDEVELLLIVAAESIARLLADDRQYGLVIEECVVEAGCQMRCARARRGNTDAEPAREFGVG